MKEIEKFKNVVVLKCEKCKVSHIVPKKLVEGYVCTCQLGKKGKHEKDRT